MQPTVISGKKHGWLVAKPYFCNIAKIAPEKLCCIPFEPPWNAGFSRDIGTFYEIRDFREDFRDWEDGPELLDTFYGGRGEWRSEKWIKKWTLGSQKTDREIGLLWNCSGRPKIFCKIKCLDGKANYGCMERIKMKWRHIGSKIFQ